MHNSCMFSLCLRCGCSDSWSNILRALSFIPTLVCSDLVNLLCCYFRTPSSYIIPYLPSVWTVLCCYFRTPSSYIIPYLPSVWTVTQQIKTYTWPSVTVRAKHRNGHLTKLKRIKSRRPGTQKKNKCKLVIFIITGSIVNSSTSLHSSVTSCHQGRCSQMC